MRKAKKPVRESADMRKPPSARWLKAVVANRQGDIFELDGYAAVGMSNRAFSPLKERSACRMPYGSELLLLPDRRPVVYDLAGQRLITISRHPDRPGERIMPVAVFNSPGYLVTDMCAHEKQRGAAVLPLFSYGAVGWSAGHFRSAAIRIDRERRQDLRLMKPADVKAGIATMRRRLPGNRIREHLQTCARLYGCPAAKNFFIGRAEAPLPTSPTCNARCIGCLSHQPQGDVACSQRRIDFRPSATEIAQLALAHIKRVRNSVVSFGQGCEGDPLLAAAVIEPAIRLIRRQTDKGTINMNTNGSMPKVMAALCDAGLDSVRISVNSFREVCYRRYFRPEGYALRHVKESIACALGAGKHVALNYLNLPGFTDTPAERDHLLSVLATHPIHMIQWRNLNVDPLLYYAAMNAAADSGPPLGMAAILENLRCAHPRLRHAYFNPPKEKWN